MGATDRRKDGSRPKGRPRRWLRLLWLGLLGLGAIVVAIAGVTLLWLNSSSGLAFVVQRGLTASEGALDGELAIDGASGHLLSRFELTGVALRDAAGAEVIGADSIQVHWRPWSLLHEHVEVHELAIVGARGTLIQGPDGLNVVRIFPAGDPDAPAKDLPVSIAIREATLVGTLTFDPDGDGERAAYRLDDLDLAGAFAMHGGRMEPRVDRLSARAIEPALGPLTLSGFAAITDGAIPECRVELAAIDATLATAGAVGPFEEPDLDLSIRLDGLRPEALAPVVDLPLIGALDADLRVRGPLDALVIAGDVAVPRGAAGIDLTTDLRSRPLAYRGTVDLETLDLSSILALPGTELPSDLTGRIEVDAAGTAPAELTGSLALDLESSSFQDWAVDRLALRATVEPDLQVSFRTLEVDAPLGSADLHGRIRVPEQRFTVAGTLAGVDLAAVGRRAAGIELGGRVHAQLDTGGGWGSPGGLWVEGDGVIRGTGIRAPATRVASLTVAFDGGFGDGGPHGTVQGAAFDGEAGGVPLQQVGVLVDLARTSASGELTASLDSDVSLRTTAQVDWSQAVRIVSDELHIEAHGSVWDSAGPTVVELREGGAIDLQGLEILGDDGRLTAEGVIAPGGISDFEAHVEQLRLAALQPALPVGVAPLRGSLGLDLTLSGPGDMPSANLKLAGAQFAYGDYGPFGLEVGIVVAGGLTTLVASAGGPDIEPLNLQGIVPYRVSLTEPGWDPDGMLQLYADIPLQDAGNLSQVLPQVSSLPPGRFGIKLSVGGTGRDPGAVLDLDLRDLELASLPAMAVNIDGRLEDGAFTVDGRLRDARAQLLGIDMGGDFDLGRLLTDRLAPGDQGPSDPGPPGGKPAGPYLGDMVTVVDVIGLPIETLRHYTAAVDPLHGKLTGEIRLDGSAFSPRLTARVGLRGGRLGEVALSNFKLDLDVESGECRAGLSVAEKAGGTLTLDVTSPVDISFAASRTIEERFGQPGLDGRLDGRDLPLGLLTAFVDGATDATGVLTASGRVGGTLLDPHPEIRVSLPDGNVCMSTLDVCYEQIQLEARSDLQELLLERFRMVSRPSRLRTGANGRTRVKAVQATTGWAEANGSIRLDPERRGETSLDLKADDLWLSDTHQLRLRTDAKVTVRGQYPDLRVRGKVDVRELKVEMGDELRRSAFPLERDPRLTVHRSTDQDEEAPDEDREPIRLVDHLDLRIHVNLNTNCWLFLDVSTFPGLGRIRPDIQLTGKLELAVDQGTVRGEGEVRTLRGHLTVLGKQFKVEEGVVTFTGSSPPDPVLDVNAVHRSRYGDITVVVEGRASSPELRFESTEYDDEADILSILLFGAPMDELRPGSSTDHADELGILAAVGFARANQAIAKLFGHSAVDMINLETNPAGPGSFGIEVGKSITDRVFLITRYRFGGVEDEENVFEAQLEIQITRSFYLEMRYGDAGNGGLELFWKRKLRNPLPGKKALKQDGG